MTRSPLQVLAEYCGYGFVGCTNENSAALVVTEHRVSVPMTANDLFFRALDKLAAEGRFVGVSANHPDGKSQWYAWSGNADASAPTRIEALAKLVEAVK